MVWPAVELLAEAPASNDSGELSMPQIAVIWTLDRVPKPVLYICRTQWRMIYSLSQSLMVLKQYCAPRAYYWEKASSACYKTSDCLSVARFLALWNHYKHVKHLTGS